MKAVEQDPSHSEAQSLITGLQEDAASKRTEAVKLSFAGIKEEAVKQITCAIETNPSLAEYHVFRCVIWSMCACMCACICAYTYVHTYVIFHGIHTYYSKIWYMCVLFLCICTVRMYVNCIAHMYIRTYICMYIIYPLHIHTLCIHIDMSHCSLTVCSEGILYVYPVHIHTLCTNIVRLLYVQRELVPSIGAVQQSPERLPHCSSQVWRGSGPSHVQTGHEAASTDVQRRGSGSLQVLSSYCVMVWCRW